MNNAPNNNLNYPYNNANNPNSNPNVNMYFPNNSQQNPPAQQNSQQGYVYGATQNQETHNYPVPQVNPEEAHREDRANFVLPESAKIAMIACSVICLLIFLILLIIK